MVTSFDEIVAQLAADARVDRAAWSADGWSRAGTALAGRAAEFLGWARAHRRWSFIAAEASAEVCAKPPEAAAWILHEIIEELLEEE
jgi:hypothetical protein